ncbi:hypothetical protein HDV01_004973 [Terramyces sp. JEL0728]|nr:hypothetical protein HDV01_004973 [Terramyces sp. JEL0728]
MSLEQNNAGDTQTITLDIQLFPHSETPLHRQDQNRPFLFTPVEKKVVYGNIVQIGRKIDRSKDTHRGTTREDRAAQNVSTDYNHMSSDKDGKTNYDCVAFRSKVVSRHHAEIWVGKDEQLYFRDVGSSSGSFLNRLRLSPSGKESRPYPLKSGDIIQLGVDYQGRQEEIYKAVMIKVFINSKKGPAKAANKQKLNKAMRMLLSAMNPNAQAGDDNGPIDCCICINTMAPFQALFLAPCSHCFHYKCVTSLLGAGFMFQCPLCRQVANLEASVQDDLDEEMLVEEDDDCNSVSAGNSSGEEIVAPAAELQSSPMNIPGSERPATTVLERIISPSTPENHSNMPINLDRHATVQLVSEPEPEVPADNANELYESLIKLSSMMTDGDVTMNDHDQMQQSITKVKAILGPIFGNTAEMSVAQKEMLANLLFQNSNEQGN